MYEWILKELVNDLILRIKNLENLNDAHTIYLKAKQDEIDFLKNELNYVEDMFLENIREFERAEDDYRINKSDAQI